MLSARQLGIARPRFIKSSEIMSRQTTVDSLLLSVPAGQPSDSIAIACSNESTFLAKSAIAYCMHNNIGFHWQMSNVSPQTVIAARTIVIVTWLGFGPTLNKPVRHSSARNASRDLQPLAKVAATKQVIENGGTQYRS